MPNIIKGLNTSTAVLAGINGVLAGVPGLILAGKEIIEMFRSDAGTTTADAQAEIDRFEAHLQAAMDKNTEYFNTRVDPATSSDGGGQ